MIKRNLVEYRINPHLVIIEWGLVYWSLRIIMRLEILN